MYARPADLLASPLGIPAPPEVSAAPCERSVFSKVAARHFNERASGRAQNRKEGEWRRRREAKLRLLCMEEEEEEEAEEEEGVCGAGTHSRLCAEVESILSSGEYNIYIILSTRISLNF